MNVVSLSSQNMLVDKFNTFPVLTKQDVPWPLLFEEQQRNQHGFLFPSSQYHR